MEQAAIIEEEMKHADETMPPPKHPDIIEEGKEEDKKRTFMTPYRPHEMIWNFIYDEAVKRPKHVLRPDAAPEKCYIDGRIQELMALIDQVAELLKTFDNERWVKLNGHVLDIFKQFEKEKDERYKEFAASEQ